MNCVIFTIFVLFIGTGLCREEFHGSEEEFEEKFRVVIEDPEEEEKEAKILQEVEKEVSDNNEAFREGKQTYKQRIYRDSNVPIEDLEKEKMGLIVPRVQQRALGAWVPSEAEQKDPINAAKLKDLYMRINADRARLPRSYNAVKQGLVTSVKNQRSCGSCAAFAATSIHETCMIKAGAPKDGLDLSEQYIIDCAYGQGANGCHGASPIAYQRWLARNGGESPHEAQYMYLDKFPIKNCSKAQDLKWNSGAKVVDSINDFRPNEENIKKLLVKYGSVSVAIYASDKGLQNYASGVYQGCRGNKQYNHGVVIVGYGTEKGVKYWLVKNSWGSDWGDNGYIKIRRGNNMCKIETIATVVDCESTGKKADPAPPMPTPKPVPTNLQCDIAGRYGPNVNGPFTFRFRMPNKELSEARMTCKDSICTPTNPGPSNACMYLCGKVQCWPRGATTSRPNRGRKTTQRPTAAPRPKPTQKGCDVRGSSLERVNGNRNFGRRLPNGKIEKINIRCKNAMCFPRGDISGKYDNVCMYVCGKPKCKRSKTRPTRKPSSSGKGKTCNVSKLTRSNNYNGPVRFKINGRTFTASCRNSVCTYNKVPRGAYLCQYICRKKTTKC